MKRIKVTVIKEIKPFWLFTVLLLFFSTERNNCNNYLSNDQIQTTEIVNTGYVSTVRTIPYKVARFQTKVSIRFCFISFDEKSFIFCQNQKIAVNFNVRIRNNIADITNQSIPKTIPRNNKSELPTNNA